MGRGPLQQPAEPRGSFELRDGGTAERSFQLESMFAEELFRAASEPRVPCPPKTESVGVEFDVVSSAEPKTSPSKSREGNLVVDRDMSQRNVGEFMRQHERQHFVGAGRGQATSDRDDWPGENERVRHAMGEIAAQRDALSLRDGNQCRCRVSKSGCQLFDARTRGQSQTEGG